MEKELFNKLLDLTKNDELSDDILYKFNKIYYKKYKNIILENALIYILDNNFKKYANIFNDNKNLTLLLNNDECFRVIITRFAFYNLKRKIILNIDNDEKIKKSNKNIFYNLYNVYKINTITSIYRKILLDFLKKFNSDDLEIILDDILTTNKYDNELIKSNDFLNKNNINQFKYFIIRVILSDNYIDIKSTEKDIDLYDELFIDEDEEDFEDKFDYEDDPIDLIDEQIVNYIENLKGAYLPNDIELRYYLYNRFVMYNIYVKEQKFDIESIKDDSETIKVLKKINPHYYLDIINTDNE